MYSFVRRVILTTKLVVFTSNRWIVYLFGLRLLNPTTSKNTSVEVKLFHLALNLDNLFVDCWGWITLYQMVSLISLWMKSHFEVVFEVVSKFKVFIALSKILKKACVCRVEVQVHFYCFCQAVTHEPQVHNTWSHAYFFRPKRIPVIFSILHILSLYQGWPLLVLDRRQKLPLYRR